MLYTRKEVQSLAGDSGIQLIDIMYPPSDFSEIDFDASQDNSLTNYLKFLKDMGIKYCFSLFSTWEAEDYLINLDSINPEVYGPSIYKKIRDLVNQYNSELESHEDGQVVSFSLHAVSDRILYSIEFTEEWYDGLEDVDDAHMKIIRLFEGEASEWQEKVRLEEQRAQSQKLKEFRQVMLGDQMYPKISTKAARMLYLQEKADELGFTDFRWLTRHNLEPFADLLLTQIKSGQ